MARTKSRKKIVRAKSADQDRQSSSRNDAVQSQTDDAATIDGDAAAHSIAQYTSPRQTWLLVALLLVGGTLAYSNSFDGVMLLDDIIRIKNNPSVHEPVLSGAWLGDRLKRPLVSLTVAFNYQLGGSNPLGYHIFNLLIHLAAGLTLFGIVRRVLLLPRWAHYFGTAAAPLAFLAWELSIAQERLIYEE